MSALTKKLPYWTIAALVVALVGNIVAALFPVCTLLQMPVGSSGRLIVETWYAFIVAVGTFSRLGSPFGRLGIIRV